MRHHKKKKWDNIDFDVHQVTAPQEFFSRFFDDRVLELIMTHTNLYAERCQLRYRHDVTVVELKTFIGFLIRMGLHNLRSYDQFLSINPLFRVEPIASTMTVTRFKQNLQGLHINDNSHATATTTINCTRWDHLLAYSTNCFRSNALQLLLSL